nr:acyl-CoA thioesterase domain-containing protein [Nocardia nova]
MAQSPWSADTVAGQALAALVARQLEVNCGAPEFRPARLTVDLLKPIPMKPLTVPTRSVREGRRIRVADAEVRCDEVTVARASCVFLRRSEDTTPAVWSPNRRPDVPPPVIPGDRAGARGPIFGSDGHPTGWSRDIRQHAGVTRKRMWANGMSAVRGDELTPFVAAAIVGEAASFVTNWSSDGIAFINADLTIALSRMPEGTAMGIEADNHVSSEGIGVGTATLFDSIGTFGTCVVTALANSSHRVTTGGLDAHNAKLVGNSGT